jgi:hypothetical protein
MDYIGLDPDILTKKVGWVRIVRQDATDFCRREKNILGALCCKKLLNLALIRQVELLMRTQQ